jgi:glycosyltransferase involved in cell wall biosynthesis
MPEAGHSQKTILMFSDWYYPGFKAGGPVQSAFNLAELLSKDFIVKVVTRITDLDDTNPYPNVEANTWTELEKNHFVLYLSPDKITSKYIKSLIEKEQYNILLINGLYSFYFSVLPTYYALIFKVSQVYIAVRGMLHRSALSVKPFKKQVFLAFARGFGLYRNFTMLATSEQERQEISRTLGRVKIQIAPNIPLLPSGEEKLPLKQRSREKLRILFLGRISPEKDPLTLIKALHLVNFPCEVTFCGAHLDKEYFARFSEQLKNLPAHIQTSYIAELPHKRIKDLFEQSDLMVMPSLGENFGHAIFESFVFAVPVIIGNNTPWTGIREKHAGIEIVPGNEKELSEVMRYFFEMDDAHYDLWRNGAFNMSKTYFRDNNFSEIYLRLFS